MATTAESSYLVNEHGISFDTLSHHLMSDGWAFLNEVLKSLHF